MPIKWVPELDQLVRYALPLPISVPSHGARNLTTRL